MEVKLSRDEIYLIQFALNQKVNSLKNNCMKQQKLINSFEKKTNSYDVQCALETVKMLFDDSQADLKEYMNVYNKFKEL